MQTADIMEGAIKIALKSRLRQHKGIDASVVCDAWGVLDGRFDNMSIIGTHWETPLQLTAHRLEVGGAPAAATIWVHSHAHQLISLTPAYHPQHWWPCCRLSCVWPLPSLPCLATYPAIL